MYSLRARIAVRYDQCNKLTLEMLDARMIIISNNSVLRVFAFVESNKYDITYKTKALQYWTRKLIHMER